MSKRHESLPYGPLTRPDFNMLSAAFHDAGTDPDVKEVAAERGVEPGDILRVRIIDMVARAAKEREEIRRGAQDGPSE